MPSEPLRAASLFGLPFTLASFREARDDLIAALSTGQRRLVVTANTDHVVRLRRRPELIDMYRAADLVLADGMPVVWGSRLVGAGLPERVTGIDLLHALCAWLAREGGSAFLLGSTEEIVTGAAWGLVDAYPGMRIAGTHHGFFDAAQDADVVDAIEEHESDVVFIGMGSPRQEEWAAANVAKLSARVVLCVGGSFEVLAGVRRRAPRWMQRAGLEWSFRLLQEPRRLWKRYLVEDAAFLPILLGERRRRRAEGTVLAEEPTTR